MTANVTNNANATIAGVANATALATNYAHDATANAAAAGVYQGAYYAATADFTVLNSGIIHGHASAYATSLIDDARAFAAAAGVAQFGAGDGIAQFAAQVTNNAGAVIKGDASAYAHGAPDTARDTAHAVALAAGVGQLSIDSPYATFDVQNSGLINAAAHAQATAYSASAFAAAIGVGQAFIGGAEPISTAHNAATGVINAFAKAVATNATTGTARAFAAGMGAAAIGAPVFHIDLSNDGDIFANAVAQAHDTAYATGVGIFALSSYQIDGTISNSGRIYASAYVNAATGAAHAVGIWDPSQINTTHIVNTGLINAYAHANDGLGAHATGILISGFASSQLYGAMEQVANLDGMGQHSVPYIYPYPEDPNKLTVVTNDGGTIWAGWRKGDGPIHRGNAINTRGVASLDIPHAPNPVLIELQGTEQPGHIFGDILIRTHDAIEVTNGKTYFDGIVNNPNKVDEPFKGSLDIFDHGTLVLCQEGWQGACDPGAWGSAGPGGLGYNPVTQNHGPAYVFVDNFSVNTDNTGTIAYQLTPNSTASNYTGVLSDGLAPPATFTPGDYSQVFANKAKLGGTLQAWFLPGVYDKNTTYSHIIEAKTIDGQFASVKDNSYLLQTSVTPVQDGSQGQYVDLNVTRTSFSAGGDTQNQKAVGGGIDSIYGSGSNLAQTLLLIDNKSDYLNALDQLSGAQYAQGLQSIIWSMRVLDDTIMGRLDCDLYAGAAFGPAPAAMPTKGMPLKAPAAVPVGCFKPGWKVWVQGHGAWNHHDGDSEAPGYKEDQYGVYAGLEYSWDPDWIAGIAGGYFNSKMNFDQWGGVSGGNFEYDGGQIAGYLGWDDKVWFARGKLDAGFYNGNASRFIAINQSPVDPHGSFNAGVWGFYGEAGRHFHLAPNWTASPFVGLNVQNGWIDGFTEADQGTGANLTVHNSDGTSVASRLGARFAAVWGNFRPEVMIAWQHEFGDTRQTVDMSFAQAPGTNFSVVSAETSRDAAVVGAGANFMFSPLNTISIMYNGYLTGDYYSNAVIGRWTYKW